jgi:hypothetical protein
LKLRRPTTDFYTTVLARIAIRPILFAAALTAGLWAGIKNATYNKKYPASFFMDLRDD